MSIISNLQKAASILAEFDFEGATDFMVGICFHKTFGERATGHIWLRKNEGMASWSKDEWKAAIDEEAKNHVDSSGFAWSSVSVESLRIAFFLEGEYSIYIEMTNVGSGLFDRVLITTSPIMEAYFTKEVSHRIRGFRDVREIVQEISGTKRMRPVPDDMTVAMVREKMRTKGIIEIRKHISPPPLPVRRFESPDITTY